MSVMMAAVAAATFNLVCAGSVETQSFTGNSSEPFSSTLRIDLDKQLWCEGDCKVTHNIKNVAATSLTLQEVNSDTLSGKELLVTRIDRETGAYHATATSESRRLGPASILIMKWTGQCERAAFTGFPVVDTKF